ncbi:MAG: ion transporter [Rhizobiales bacterium]|jgi:voltage-gated sodium channel|nr:ion transporter [Hyphomicrobiales bacterium]MBL6770844.1 ion transporter [Hyphomicrobiales bacterium]
MNRNLFKNIKDHRLFQAIVVFAIILSALLVGASTYNIPPSILFILHSLDVLITLFFVVEISIRFFAEKRKLHFFKDGWNIFDTIIVIASIIPVGPNSSILVLRLLRIFRVLRLISAIPELKELIESLLKSLKRVFYVSLLLFIIIYVYASIGSILFATSDPGRWGDLGVAMITLFQVLTLSSWETVMLPMQEIFWWAWIYFYSFIAIGSITILNLIIAVLVDVVTNKE